MNNRYILDSRTAKIRQIFTLLAIVAAFGMNVWANINPPNGLTIGAISNRFFSDILITPANYAFAIWGIIYLGLISFAIYQAFPAQRVNPLLRKISYQIAIASLAQIVWVFCFLYRQYAWSFLAMLGILLPLISAYLRLPFDTRISQGQKWLVRTPVSLYLAWISVATIVNAATVLKSWSWDGWGISAPVWTVAMLLIAALITTTVTVPRLDFAYVSVFVWALIAIAIKNINNIIISGTAIGLAVMLIILLLFFSLYFSSNRNIGNN